MGTKGMMRCAFIAILAASVGACSSDEDPERKKDAEKVEKDYGYSSSFDSFALSSGDLKKAEVKAIAGDMASLKIVVDYYTYSSPLFEDGYDKVNVLKWTELGASRGNITYISNYLLFSARSAEPCGKISKYYNILKEKNPKDAEDRNRGRVKECL